jgi:glucose/arabinose dehydrogenase
MKRQYPIIIVLLLFGASLLFYLYRGYLTPVLPSAGSAGAALAGLRVPPGFTIQSYADDVPGARSLALSPSGTLFVGTRREGKVYALVDDDRDFRADRIITLAEGLHMPNGVAFHNGALYVAEVSRILRFADIENHLQDPPEPEVISTHYPGDEHHGWKFIAFGPDGRLYVPVGAPCNICQPDNAIYASITRLNPDGSGQEIVAHGVRNTVGFDWHPQSGELWFTDNGRDWLGENRPPDELNRVSASGQHFGFPFCHGNGIVDHEFEPATGCDEFTPPVQELGPHVASLGMRFYRGSQFPQRYRNGIFIAEHGSWNRKVPTGYRVMFVALDGNRPLSYEVFAEGWLRDGIASGRPVDVEVMADGSLLVSDDKGGRIYRIAYTGQGSFASMAGRTSARHSHRWDGY